MSFPAPPLVHVLHVPGFDPARDETVSRLARDADVCVHPDPARVGVVHNWLGLLDCALRTCNAEGHEWAVQLNDDVAPCRGWQQHLERATRWSPAPILGLTYFGGWGRRCLDHDPPVPYAVGPDLAYGAAVAYHRTVLAGMREWAGRMVAHTAYPHDDTLVLAYAVRAQLPTALTARALFELPRHRSTMNHNTPVREPGATIAVDEGPDYAATPRSIRVARSPGPIKELAATPLPVPGRPGSSPHLEYARPALLPTPYMVLPPMDDLVPAHGGVR